MPLSVSSSFYHHFVFCFSLTIVLMALFTYSLFEIVSLFCVFKDCIFICLDNPLVCHRSCLPFKEVNKNRDEYKSIVVTPNKYIFSVFLQAISKMHHLLNSIL